MKAEILKLFNTGMRKIDIANTLGITKDTVQKNTPLLGKKEFDKIKYIELYEKGFTHSQIGKKLGNSESQVQRILSGYKREKTIRRAKKIAANQNKRKDELDKITPRVKRFWDEGYSKTAIARSLKVSFYTVDSILKSLNLGYVPYKEILKHQERDPKKIYKDVDRHSGKIKVKLNEKTEVYMDPQKWDSVEEFKQFKIKQLGL